MENALIDETPSYSDRVTAYLEKNHRRRLPWGTMVVGGHLAPVTTSTKQALRSEMGEVAIALLVAMGLPMALLEALVNSTPWNVTPSELLAKVETLRTSPLTPALASVDFDLM